VIGSTIAHRQKRPPPGNFFVQERLSADSEALIRRLKLLYRNHLPPQPPMAWEMLSPSPCQAGGVP